MSLDPALYTAAGVVATAVGTIAAARARAWWQARRAQADETTAEIEATAAVRRTELVRAERVEVAAFAHDAAVSPVLVEAIRGYQAEVAAIRKERDEDRKKLDDCVKQHAGAKQAHEECKGELAIVRAENGRVAARLADFLRDSGRETTGLHELDAIAARSTTPIPPAIPAPAMRTPRKTIRPPDEGGKE